ncbi:hypothetical protein QOZ80_5AG0382610 [Eleusine coracana subsp. coracana]|nr:hypothetical protein QOZ80_5AG0382610 [Eleusine coracana subsp. coracana]
MDLLDLGVQVTCPATPGDDFAFAATETDAAFLILAHLPGYAKDDVDVRVGAEVAVRVARKEAFAVEAVAAGRVRVAHRQVVEGFRRVFAVPPGVDVGRITVGFEEDDGLLVVIMPKLRQEDDGGGGDEEEEARLEVESAECDWESLVSGEEVEVEPEPEPGDVPVEVEVEVVDDEASSIEMEHEDWVDVESEPEPPSPPRDVPVETQVEVVEEREVPFETEVAVETPVEVVEEREVPVETPVLVEDTTPVVDIECDVVFDPPYREPVVVETPIEVVGPPYREPEEPVGVPPVDIPCHVEFDPPPPPPVDVVPEPEETKPAQENAGG